jgi:enoyl-CoA hydratase/carnithine racemase
MNVHEDDAILVTKDRGVALITLNRPERMNALTAQMQEDYVAALRKLDADPQVRVIVVTGAGRGFCAGADIGALEDNDQLIADTPGPESLPVIAMDLRKPVVAAVNGAVAGIGFALMMAADVRFAAANARIGTTFSRLGLVAEYGMSWLLPRAIGVGAALELLLSGRFVAAEEALRLGLVQEVVPEGAALERALAWAHDVADNCSPRSLAEVKRQVYDDLEGTRAGSIARALSLMRDSFEWGGLHEALAARQEKRRPRFPAL